MTRPSPAGAEHTRLNESPSASSPWRQWGPYLSGRQWGTVREDYSADGDAWNSFPFEQAHARAYRWGDDGLGGFCDNLGFLNFSIALWNGHDPILKERLYGLTNEQGNHGEDAKEYWWAVDGTPTHSWMKWLYRYPQAEYPYAKLKEENGRRTRADREYELADTGVLDENRFFDVSVTYAKAAPDDICIEIEVTNHGPNAASLHLLPQLWFRNTWAWGRDDRRPSLHAMSPMERGIGHLSAIATEHAYLGRYVLCTEGLAGRPGPEVLVCANETNAVGLWGVEKNSAPFTKDGVNRRVVDDDKSATRPLGTSGSYPDSENDTKAAFWYRFDSIGAGETVRVRLRLSREDPGEQTFDRGFDAVMADRQAEADEFYAVVVPAQTSAEDTHIARRAFAGLLWGKQIYRYDVQDWLDGDPAPPQAPASRRYREARNVGWTHLSLADVISMPDEWEYPWFAAWDLAFHCVAFAHIDPAFAKDQLVLMCREWAMRPDGQLPSYEWAFGDLNPPVHAWAAWQVYNIDGRRDTDFLIRV
ncbi:MAG: hypothetical protein JWM76_1479, partial [Pseudonocardiales bacterium]|nr:hypothetical protein [Pseudonocardiales bacterium]